MATAGLSQLAVTVLVFTGSAHIGTLIALSAVNGTAAAFSMPATAALLGQVIPAEARQQANAITSFTRSGAMIIGAGLGGVLVATLGPGVGLAVYTALLRWQVSFALVPGQASTTPEDKRSPISDLRDGWRELVTYTWLGWWCTRLGL